MRAGRREGRHTKTRWQSSLIDVDAGAHRVHDKWCAPEPRMKWKEVHHTVDQLRFFVERQDVRKAQKKESDAMLMVDELVSGGKMDEQTPAIMVEGPKHLRTVSDE